ncbi:MAG TPA: carotenoid oxygenase family protein, partial [Polyangia bacterium]
MSTPALRPLSRPEEAPVTGAGAHAWHRAFRDLPRQHGFVPLRIEGRLPEGLRGTLYRTGPALFSTFGRRYGHWFDGDGAVSAVRFDGGGGATGAVKLVESAGLAEERRRGRPLYPGYGTRAPSLWRGLVAGLRGELKNSGNTSVMIWQGRLYAMLEACRPTELSIEDLSTLGERDLDGAVVQSFSAHPHYVPARRAAYNFGVRYGRRTELDLFELPDAGAARRLGTVTLPGATMIHDFIATERHLVFFVPPLRLRIFRQLVGLGTFGDNLRWRPDEGTEVLVVPIDAPSAVRRFTVPAFY